MFERFTAAARQVVVGAQEQARLLGHNHIGTEHLLLGLFGDSASVAARVLTGLGVERDHILEGVAEHIGPSQPDAQALATLGIDLDEVRRKAEEAFGPGALGRTRRRGKVTGHVPFTPRAKKVLELSLRESLRMKHRWIGPEHVLLALLREGQGVAAVLLSERGVTHVAVEERVVEALAAGTR
ncbi:MAG: Clp protease [Euzebyaceae bacterium]|jgi:ATP-dependent Clp protease ATP-binding subunit ClpA|nr:Clp protease [Euzebyaceae bacterium]